jgi:hypothetical protein
MILLSPAVQLHEGLKKLRLRPSIFFSREDFDDFTCGGCKFARGRKKKKRGRNNIYCSGVVRISA